MSDIRELLESKVNLDESPEMREWKVGLLRQLRALSDMELVEITRVILTSLAVRMSGTENAMFPSMELHEHALIDALECLKRSVYE